MAKEKDKKKTKAEKTESRKVRTAKRKAKVEKINRKSKRKHDPKRKGKKWTIELTHAGVTYSCGPFATEADAEEYEKLVTAIELDADGLPE